jgi:hypothetical protein
MIKLPKDSDCLSARNVIGSSEQRNKWQGPAKGGKDTVYAGYELEPMEWSATDGGELLLLGFSRLVFFFSVCAAACSAGSIFWLPQRLLSERELSVGARFKLLSVGVGSKHRDLCNEQISDSNERFNLNRGGS